MKCQPGKTLWFPYEIREPQRSTIAPMLLADDDVESLLDSVVERFDGVVASDAVARAFTVACREATSAWEETYAAGLNNVGCIEAVVAAFDKALKTELRRLLRTH